MSFPVSNASTHAAYKKAQSVPMWKRARRALQNRYFYPKSGYKPRLENIAQDVALLQSMVNAEKKRIVQYSDTNLVGQVNGNNSGHYLVDITPLPAQGTDYNKRNGNSIKWHSFHGTLQFYSQSAFQARCRLKILLVECKGTARSSATDVIACLTPTPFLGGGTVWDTNSEVNPDYFNDYRIIKRWDLEIPADTLSNQPLQTTFEIGYKFKNKHVKWSTDGTTVVQGQVCMIILAENGNVSSGTASTLTGGISITAVSTGLVMARNMTHYFYDN